MRVYLGLAWLFAWVCFWSPAALSSQNEIQGITFDSNVDAKLKAQVIDDFKFLETLTATRQSPIHQEIFGAVDGAVYLNWFNQRVFYFGVSTCGGPSSVACFNSKYPHKIWVSKNYINGNYPQIARIMTLFHEARHTELDRGQWAHARCPVRFPHRSIWTGDSLRGNFACDSTVYGSYASAAVMLNNISKFCTNCTDQTRAEAKRFSDDQAKRVIHSAAKKRLAKDFQY